MSNSKEVFERFNKNLAGVNGTGVLTNKKELGKKLLEQLLIEKLMKEKK